jgi:ferredoxin
VANVIFSSPILPKDVTVYAVAGDTKTILSVAEASKVKIPLECRDGECGSCLIKVTPLEKGNMAATLTEKEKAKLKELGMITNADIARAEVDDVMPAYRLACQYIVRDQDILVEFTGSPGGAA